MQKVHVGRGPSPSQLLEEIRITAPDLAGAAGRPRMSVRTPPVADSEPTLPIFMPGQDGSGSLAPRGGADPVAPLLEIEDGETTLFEAAITSFHAGDFQRAESLFLEEAARTLEAAPQRAAIAYRQAALAAAKAGNHDGSDHWMRLAGREYLRVTEDDRTPLPFIREAAVMAAKCFLSVDNLNVASKGLRRAQAIESVLRADDDLMAAAAEARGTGVGGPSGAAETGGSRAIAGDVRVEVRSARPAATDDTVGWIERRRHRRFVRSVA